MEHIYQASDLATKRVEILQDARTDRAHIRLPDGTALVMLPQSKLDLLQSLREVVSKLLTLIAGLQRPQSERRPTDFGEFSWLMHLDEDDQQTFRQELVQAFMDALSRDDFGPVQTCLHDWRVTALALSDEKSRRVHTSPGQALDTFVEVRRPE